jgi:hypothetical protein
VRTVTRLNPDLAQISAKPNTVPVRVVRMLMTLTKNVIDGPYR